MVKVKDHDLVLSQAFLNYTKFSQEYKLDEIFDTITHLETYQTTLFYILTPEDPSN